MKDNFVREQEEVVTLKNKDRYDEAIKKCDEILIMIKNDYPEDNHNLWFFNLILAMCYRKKGQCKKALSYVSESKNYTNDFKEHMECNWVMGNCYYSLKLDKKAIKFFKQCSDYFTNNKMQDERIHMDFNIAKIEKDDEKIKELLTEVHNIISTKDDSFNNAEWFFNNAYETLCEIYIEKNQIKQLDETIVKIKDENIVVNLRSRIQAVNNYCSNSKVTPIKLEGF